jgi:carbamate kinase
MKRKTVVIAIGGNAILKRDGKGTADEQFESVDKTCGQIIDMIELGYKVILTHGNGPQVGNILLQNEAGVDEGVPSMPLDVCVSESQGQIGYILQQTLENHLRKRGKLTQVVSFVTQVLVDKKDPAFEDPTKPIGPFYTKKQATALRKRNGWAMMEDAGRGYRRIVPSPMPQRCIERRAVKKLTKQGSVVIACGGGGVPVILERNRLKGVEAVIDKDLASAVLAGNIGAQMLIILTDVEKVSINYGKENEETLDIITMTEAKAYLEEGHFPPGSMGPKIEAAIIYLRKQRRGQVIITSTDTLLKALKGKTGTRIIRSDAEKRHVRPEKVDETKFVRALNI